MNHYNVMSLLTNVNFSNNFIIFVQNNLSYILQFPFFTLNYTFIPFVEHNHKLRPLTLQQQQKKPHLPNHKFYKRLSQYNIIRTTLNIWKMENLQQQQIKQKKKQLFARQFTFLLLLLLLFHWSVFACGRRVEK